MSSIQVMLFALDSKKEISTYVQVDTPELLDGFVVSADVSGEHVVSYDYYYFPAFQGFRDKLLLLGYGIKCNGSRLNVFFSEEIGFYDKVYLIETRKQLIDKDAVSIWDYADIEEFPTTDEQSDFYQQWNANNTYIATLKMDDVPWNRLTTANGRAADFPVLFNVIREMKDRESVVSALNNVISNTEHQSTLWHASPFMIVFLARVYNNAISEMETNEIANYIVNQLSDFFGVVSKCCQDVDKIEHAKELPFFSDLLKEEYLWSDEYDKEEDEMRYEEANVFPPELWYSFYYYSLLVLPDCEQVSPLKSIQEIFDSLDKRQKPIKNENKILVNDDIYRSFLKTYSVDEIIPDIQLYYYEDALNMNNYLENNYKKISVDLWVIGSSGQGDSWFINKQTLSIMFYNHEKGEYKNMADFEDLGINFTQFLQMAFVLKGLEQAIFDEKQELNQQIKTDFIQKINSVKPGLFELYPYKYW